MNRSIVLTVIHLFLFGWWGWLVAAQLPEQGFAAEVRGQWRQALEIYEAELARSPNNPALWRRVADIHAKFKRLDQAANALEQALKSSPDDAQLHMRLSQTYSMAGRPEQALAACSAAIALDGSRLDWWRAQAQLAAWAGDWALARASNEHLLDKNPANLDPLLQLARIKSWQGELDDAVDDFGTYLEAYPEAQAAIMDFVKAETWRGNYPAALALLERYAELAGKDDTYHQYKARVLAWAEKPEQALEQLKAVKDSDADGFQESFTRTLAVRKMRRPEETMRQLALVESMQAGLEEVIDLGRSTRLPYRSRTSLGYSYYEDSDGIKIGDLKLRGQYQLNLKTHIDLVLRHADYTGKAGSGLEPISGGNSIEESNLSIGLSHLLSPAWEIGGRFGLEQIDRQDDFATYEGFLDWRPHSDFNLRFTLEKELLGISPRSVSLGIKRNTKKLRVLWRPGIRYTVDLAASLDDLSDDNTRNSILLGIRRNTVRGEHLNLDLGVLGWWLSYDKNLNNGYYDPSDYRLFMLTANFYHKIDDDNGIALGLAGGIQRDETFEDYQFAGDASIEGIFGVFQDWLLRVRLAYTERQQQSGAFDAFSASAFLEHRF